MLIMRMTRSISRIATRTATQVQQLGTTKRMNFRKRYKGGHFNPKNRCCRFWTFKQGFLRMKFEEKKLQHDTPKMRGGGQRLFGNFPLIHPNWADPSLTINSCTNISATKIISNIIITTITTSIMATWGMVHLHSAGLKTFRSSSS